LLGGVIIFGIALFLLSWYFTVYDLGTSEYRQLGTTDLIVPLVVVASAFLFRFTYRFLLRDKN
jgi:hypothetical protein